MKEIIGSILQAEEMATQLVNDATEKAKNIEAQRESDVEKFKVKTVALFELERKKALSEAQTQAEQKYEQIIEKANEQAEQLVESVSGKIDGVADIILKDILM